MAKKRFSEGLDSLFANFGTQKERVPTVEPLAAPKKKGTGKFSSDLDALLQEALEESLDKYQTNAGATTNAETQRATFSGIDALIRQTIDVKEEDSSGTRRLTVAVDKTKLEKLKVIARLENAYLKDLLVNVIDGYILDYTQSKGVRL